MRIARTQNILVRNWTCPSGRLTAGSRSVRGLRAYRRLFFCSSRGIAHFPAAAGRTTSPPAPRPCFLPRPCVRLPLSLRVLETILRLLDDHPQEQFVDLLSAIPEVAAVVVAAFDVPKSSSGRRKSNDGP